MTGRIITYYSYKGGTGRSMALANAAWILAGHGKRVLVLDWDLEAPGLHRYLHPFLPDKDLLTSPGVIDLMWAFVGAAMDPSGSRALGWHEPYARISPYAMSVDHEFPGDGTIDLVPAGRQDGMYASQVGSFDWTNFYERLGGWAFLESLREDMRGLYDYVLIDSRTGVSDTSGICTVHLPDILVNCFTASIQSIEGSAAVARSVRLQRPADDLRILPVPMRVEDGEQDKLRAAQDYWQSLHAEFITDAEDPVTYWAEVEVPYLPYYAYEEIVAAIGDRPGQRRTILAACEALVRRLTDGEIQALVPMPEFERRRLETRYHRADRALVPGARGGPAPVYLYWTGTEEITEPLRRFWVFLRRHGVDARLPQAELGGSRVRAWRREQLADAGFIIVVGLGGPDEQKSPDDETVRDLLGDRADWYGRVLPVLLPGGTVEDLPGFLGMLSNTYYTIADFTVAGAEALLRVLTDQPAEAVPQLGTTPHLTPREAGTEERYEVPVAVQLDGDRLTTQTRLPGAEARQHRGIVPYGLRAVWANLGGPPEAAQQWLTETGRQLAAALFDDQTLRLLTELVESTVVGVDIIVAADQDAANLPLEVLCLPDGRPFVTLPTVGFRRTTAGMARPMTPALPGPLKILAAVAAPHATGTGKQPLDTEAEMQALVDAGGLRPDAVQVTILEVAGLPQIAEALRAEQYHVLHVSAHGADNLMELEDEDGNAVPVSAAQLADAIRTGMRPLPLAVLSFCAGPLDGDFPATLLRRGVDRVIAMQTTVTDRYATRFAAELYRTLAEEPVPTVAAALNATRRLLEQGRTRSPAVGAVPARPEYPIPALLTPGGDGPLHDPAAPAAPLSRPASVPAGPGVLDLPLGYHIGRRRELRLALTVLRSTAHAVDEFGVSAGVLITGIGGIGKSALAGRVRTRLREDGWLIVVHRGAWNPQALFAATAEAAGEATEILRDPRLDDNAKLRFLAGLLQRVRLLLVFDDFDANLTFGGDSFTDDSVATVLATLCASAGTGRLLVTSRFPGPLEEHLLVRIDLPPLTGNETFRLLLRLPALRDLPPEELRTIADSVGGHPRLLEFVDALMRRGRANLRHVSHELHARTRGPSGRLRVARTLPQAVEEAVDLGGRDIQLPELLARLTAFEHQVLLQTAASADRLTIDELAVACRADRREVLSATERLTALTLLSEVDDGVVMHRWVAAAVASEQGGLSTARHGRIADIRLERLRSGRATAEDLLALPRDLAEADRFDDLVAFADEINSPVVGERLAADVLAEILPVLPTDHRGYARVADRRVLALSDTANTAAALDTQRRLLDVLQAGGGGAIDDLAKARCRLGDLLVAAGDTSQARQSYEDALAAGGDRAARIIAGRRAALSTLIEDTDAVLRRHRSAADMAAVAAAADPGGREVQRNLSIALNRLAAASASAGDLPVAESLCRQALDLRKSAMAAGDPRAYRDLSFSHLLLGDLLAQGGDLPAAGNEYRQAAAISRQRQPDPADARDHREFVLIQVRLGDLFLMGDEPATAADRYGHALAVSQRLTAADPANAHFRRDLAVACQRIGVVALQAGDLRTAEERYREALRITDQLAVADPGNLQVQLDRSGIHGLLGGVAWARGDLAEATSAYRAAVAISERLAQADPGKATVARLLRSASEHLDHGLRGTGDRATSQHENDFARRSGEFLSVAGTPIEQEALYVHEPPGAFGRVMQLPMVLHAPSVAESIDLANGLHTLTTSDESAAEGAGTILRGKD